jgi:mRNA interferase RelE/StbE
MKDIAFSKEALKALRRMPRNVAELIRAKIDLYAREPESLASNIAAIKSMPGYMRMRVNDGRVVFSDDGIVVSIVRIAPRGSVYD